MHVLYFRCLKGRQNCASLRPLLDLALKKAEGVGKLCCKSIWLLCGSLCSLKGKEDMFPLSSRQALLPGSYLPNYHPYKEAKRPLTSAGLSPPLVLQPVLLLPCRSCLSASLCLLEHSPSAPRSVFSPSLTASPPPLSFLYSLPNTLSPFLAIPAGTHHAEWEELFLAMA